MIVGGLLLFGSAGRDDSYITYWAARSLAEHGSIVNYNGDPVEQSSSLLHVWVLAVAYRITGVGLATLGPLVSLAFGSVAVACVAAIGRGVSTRFMWIAALLCGLEPFLAYWSSSGLETSLAAVLTLGMAHWGGRFVEQPSRGLGLAVASYAAALVQVRPEGIAVLACWAGLLAAWRRFDRASLRLGLVVGVGAASFGVTAIWRSARDDSMFPLPVEAKFGWEPGRLLDGLGYLQAHVLTSVSCVVLLAAGVFALRRRSSLPVTSYAAAIATQLAFATVAGGDWMEGGRFVVPMLPALILSGVAGIETLTRTRRVALAAVVLALVADALVLTARHSTGMPFFRGQRLGAAVLATARVDGDRYSFFELHNRMHLREIPTIDRLDDLVTDLHETLGRPVVVMTMQMGMVAYYASEAHGSDLRWLDRMGLTTTEVSHCELLDDLPRTPYGIEMRYEHYFERRDALERQCGFPTPDLVYDVTASRTIASHGYRIVYRQDGNIETPGLLRGAEIRSHQYIAVHADLLARLPARWRAPQRLTWPRAAMEHETESGYHPSTR